MSRWKLSTPLSVDASGINIPMEKILQNTTWELAGVPDLKKVIYRSMQKIKEARKKEEESDFEWTFTQGWRSCSRGESLTSGQSVLTKEKHLRLSESEAWMNGMRTIQSVLSPYVPQTSSPECAVIGSWSVETGEQFQGKDCCWLQGGGTREQEGGEYGGECLWRKERQSWMQGTTAKSCTGGGTISVDFLSPHTSISNWPREKTPEKVSL